MDTVGKSIDLARELLSPVGQTLSDAWSTAIGDRMGFWRAKNAMRYQLLLAEQAKRLGLKVNPQKSPTAMRSLGLRRLRNTTSRRSR
ncbi:MAG: hypothetical protein EOO77_02460 [Oxalobacteraceae bacterium]|nr:MAG: hypothetical protein EOO77_02460 [Oxalobacteraceae bacterium]